MDGILAHLGERREQGQPEPWGIQHLDGLRDGTIRVCINAKYGDSSDCGRCVVCQRDTLRAQAAAHGEEIKRLAEALAGVHNVSDDKTREIERQAAAHGESVRELQVRMLKVTEMLEEALQHATEYRDGCLYCGEGDIIDGTTTPEHRATCWWYRGRALLAEVGKS